MPSEEIRLRRLIEIGCQILISCTKSKILAGFISDLQNRLFQALTAKMALGVEFAPEVAPASLLRRLGGMQAVDRLPRLSIAWVDLEWQVSRNLSKYTQHLQ